MPRDTKETLFHSFARKSNTIAHFYKEHKLHRKIDATIGRNYNIYQQQPELVCVGPSECNY